MAVEAKAQLQIEAPEVGGERPQKHVFLDCIWSSDENKATKLVLLAIGRFLDTRGRGSSMSYAQIARACTVHERTVKRIVARVKNHWLEVEVGKGHRTSSGRQNLYHGLCPPDMVRRLQEQSARKGWQGVVED